MILADKNRLYFVYINLYTTVCDMRFKSHRCRYWLSNFFSPPPTIFDFLLLFLMPFVSKGVAGRVKFREQVPHSIDFPRVHLFILISSFFVNSFYFFKKEKEKKPQEISCNTEYGKRVKSQTFDSTITSL